MSEKNLAMTREVFKNTLIELVYARSNLIS